MRVVGMDVLKLYRAVNGSKYSSFLDMILYEMELQDGTLHSGQMVLVSNHEDWDKQNL